MNDNQSVVVKIVGDASGVQPAVQITEQSLAGMGEMVATLRGQMTTMTTAMAEGFTAVRGSVEALSAQIVTVGATARTETGLLSTMGVRVRESWEGLTGIVSKFNGALLGLSAALAGGELFEHAIKATTEWTSDNLRLAQSLGITLERASGLHITLNKLGIGVDQVTGASQRMVRQLKIHEGSINELGIVTRDSNGHFRDTLDILVDGMGRLNDYQAGVDRTAAAQRLFGRGAGDLTNMLRLTNEQIEEGTRVAHELGMVTTEEGVQAMRNYKDAVHETEDVVEALKIQIGNGLLPALTDLANWMRGHGKQSTELFAGVIRDTIDAFRWIIVSVKESLAQLSLWGAELSGLQERVTTFCDEVSQVWGLMGKVFGDFPNWTKMRSDWESGMAAIDRSVSAHVSHIESEIGAAKRALQILQTEANVLGRKPGPGQDALGSGNPFDLSGLGKQPPRPDVQLGGGDRLDTLKDPKKEKGDKASIAEQLEAELEAKKTAWAEAQLAQDTAQQFSLQSEVDFWAAALRRTDLGTKDKLAIEKSYVAAAQALQKQRIEDQLAQYQLDLQSAGQNWDKKLAILKQEQAYVARTYGAESKEAKDAARQVLQAEKEKAKQLRELDVEIARGKEAAALAGVDASEAAAQFEVEMGRKSRSELLSLEKQFENQRFIIRKQELDREKALIDPTRDPVAYQKISQQLEQLEMQHQLRLTDIDRKAVLQRTQIERGGINQVASSWGSALAKFATLQAGFNATIKSLWQGLQQAIGSVIEQLLTKFIAAELTKLIFGKATAQQSIVASAAQAGAAGVASWAGAPWPIDAGAPAFGASMSAAAMAFSGLNAAEGGWWDVKPGLAMLHSNEMVLPAWAAQGVRSMIGGGQGPANFNAPTAANDMSRESGHTFIFNGPVNRAQLKRWFVDNHQAVGAGVHQFVRQLGSTTRT